MRNVTNNAAQPAAAKTPNLQTFSTTLSDGREIIVREMTGRDLIYLEEELSKKSETRKTFHLLERLNVGEIQVNFDEIADLAMKDINKLTALVAKANGSGEEEDSPK